jgi:hypothetical protein
MWLWTAGFWVAMTQHATTNSQCVGDASTELWHYRGAVELCIIGPETIRGYIEHKPHHLLLLLLLLIPGTERVCLLATTGTASKKV